MTRTANGERYCSQHRQPRSECRPDDRHTQPLRTRDNLIAAVAARGGDIGLHSVNDAMEMALEAWLRLPLAQVAEQALADRRIRHLPPGPEAAVPDAPREVSRRPASPGAIPFREPTVKP